MLDLYSLSPSPSSSPTRGEEFGRQLADKSLRSILLPLWEEVGRRGCSLFKRDTRII
jgi:hypothetical protein